MFIFSQVSFQKLFIVNDVNLFSAVMGWLVVSVIQLLAHFHMVNPVSQVIESKVGSPIHAGLKCSLSFMQEYKSVRTVFMQEIWQARTVV
jgi:hypothetical protein